MSVSARLMRPNLPTSAGGAPPSPPAAPTLLIATSISASEIDLSWTSNSVNEDGFKIESSPTGSGSWTQINIVSMGATTYHDTGLSDGQKVFYRVRAYNAGGNSSYTNTANAITTLIAPSALMATPVSSSEIDLSWTNTSVGFANIEVQRSPDNSTWATIATLGQVNSYQNTGLTASTQYYYQIRATNAVANSSYSASANATTQATPTTFQWYADSTSSPSGHCSFGNFSSVDYADINIVDENPTDANGQTAATFLGGFTVGVDSLRIEDASNGANFGVYTIDTQWGGAGEWFLTNTSAHGTLITDGSVLLTWTKV